MTAGSGWSRLLPRQGRRATDAGQPPIVIPPVAALIDRLAGPLDPLAELLIEQTVSGVLIMDRRGMVVRANARLRRMLGDDAAAPAGLPAMALFAASERDTLWDRLHAVLLGQLAPSRLLARLACENGDGMAVDISPLVLRELDGGASGLILRLVDMSAQRQLEAQLAQSQKLQAVGQLAAGIAHDFNNLLTAIVGAADMIEARPGMDPVSREDALEIRGSAERGAALVRQLLAFGRQQSLRPAPIQINAAITQLSGLLTRLLGAGITLKLDLEQPGCMICVDPTQLDQVLINLAVNARDAMAEGGTLTLRSGHIALYRPLVRGPETIPPGRYIMIEVQDTGAGIDPDLLPRIFDPFVTTRRDRGGTGLGLSTVHGIIRQSDGFLGVESELGSGTRMRIYLPRHDEGVARIPDLPIADGCSGGSPPAASPPAASPPAVSPPAVSPPAVSPPAVSPAMTTTPAAAEQTGAALILLVDDEAGVRRLAERALAAAGWSVLVADSGDAAVALIERERPRIGLLISDVVMPGLDGPALARILRQTWPELPVLFMSGYADERLRETLDLEGAGFLAKPYRLPELLGQAAALLKA